MIRSIYLRLYDRLVHRWIWVLGALALCFGLTCLALPRLRIDMSFRPLFADATGPTDEFEEVFGQASGAHIGAILEAPDVLDPGFLARLDELSKRVARLDHVVEVSSLTETVVPVWEDGRLSTRTLLEEELHPQSLVSKDRRRTMLLARLDIPMQDLEGRRPVIEAFRRTVGPARFTGMSVVEEAYARILLESILWSVGLTVVAVALVLLVMFRHFTGVLVGLSGVSLAVPMTLGVMAATGQPVTIVNAIIATMILIIGVADAIHMQQSFLRHRRRTDRAGAVRAMFGEMALPCILTTATTAVGFLSLLMARIPAIRHFGLFVAVGIVIVYVANQVLVPLLLRRLPEPKPIEGGLKVDRFIFGTPVVVVALFVALVSFCIAVLPQLKVDQRFNEEVSEEHPIRSDQALMEREFTGFLGPELSIRRRAGGPVTDEETMGRILALRRLVLDHPEVLEVRSFVELIPADAPVEVLDEMRGHPRLGHTVRERINADRSWAAVSIRTRDMGTERAMKFQARLANAAQMVFGSAYEVETVGQWWLAQRGMNRILRDMLVSFGTSCLFILPMMALVLRRMRLFVISLLPNVVPMLFAVGLMAALGIPVRIGTALILPIALGIAIDDTIHFMLGLEEQTRAGRPVGEAVRRTLGAAGRAIVFTSVILILGFLSMLWNDLIAIRDMGIVAAATLAIALACDLLLAPALYVIAYKRA